MDEFRWNLNAGTVAVQYGFNYGDRFPCHVVAHIRQIGEREHRAFEPEQSIDLPSGTNFPAQSGYKSNPKGCIWVAGAHYSPTGTEDSHGPCSLSATDITSPVPR